MPRPSTYLEIGQKFGYLTYIQDAPPSIGTSGGKIRRLVCKCECGVTTNVLWQNVRLGKTTSCGCHSRDKQYTHGLSKHPQYKMWVGMIARCYDQKAESYDNYGGRGIKVCREWRNNPEGLIAFIKWSEANGYVPGLEIDRKNNDIGYTPCNCRFVTRRRNAGNRRDSLRVFYDNKEYTFTEFWEDFGLDGVSYRSAVKRLKRGYSPIDAVTTLPKK